MFKRDSKGDSISGDSISRGRELQPYPHDLRSTHLANRRSVYRARDYNDHLCLWKANSLRNCDHVPVPDMPNEKTTESEWSEFVSNQMKVTLCEHDRSEGMRDVWIFFIVKCERISRECFIPTKFLWIHTFFWESNGDFNERVSDFLEPDHGLLKISHYPRFSHFQELLFACAFPRFWASGDFWVTREATNDIQKSQFAPRIRAWSPTMQISGPFTFFALPVRYDSFSFSFGLFSRFLLVFHAHMAVILWFAF